MNDIRKLIRIEMIVLVLFIFFKSIRKGVLENNPNEVIRIFLLSFPNFCEGVIGVLILTIIGLLVKRRIKIAYKTIYLIATILAAIYVITQEFKIHNLGGENVYDPNDLIFSVIGLITGYIIVHRISPRINANTN